MRIGIIVHSKTGRTLALAQLIEKRLKRQNHAVTLHHLAIDPDIDSPGKPFRIVNAPDPAQYDALLIGGPVWAFSASPVVISYLKSLGDLKGKKLIPFATMGFPCACLGGNRSLGQMRKAAEANGATTLPGAVVPTMLRDHAVLSEEAADKITALFG